MDPKVGKYYKFLGADRIAGGSPPACLTPGTPVKVASIPADAYPLLATQDKGTDYIYFWVSSNSCEHQNGGAPHRLLRWRFNSYFTEWNPGNGEKSKSLWEFLTD